MFFDYADLATERERQSTTGKRVERTELDFRSPIYRVTIGQASCKPVTAVNLKKPGTASQILLQKKTLHFVMISLSLLYSSDLSFFVLKF